MSGEELCSTFVLTIHSQEFKVYVRVEYVDGPLIFTITEIVNCQDDTDWTMILDLDYVQRLILSSNWENTL